MTSGNRPSLAFCPTLLFFLVVWYSKCKRLQKNIFKVYIWNGRNGQCQYLHFIWCCAKRRWCIRVSMPLISKCVCVCVCLCVCVCINKRNRYVIWSGVYFIFLMRIIDFCVSIYFWDLFVLISLSRLSIFICAQNIICTFLKKKAELITITKTK